jgi:hypothetical protein
MKKWKTGDYPNVVFISVLAKSSSKQIHLHHVEKSDIKILFDIAEMWKTYNAGKYTTLVYNEKGEEKWRYDHKPGALCYAFGGAMYINIWQEEVEKALQ